MPSTLSAMASMARKQKSIAARNPHTEGEVLHLIDFERGGRRIVRAGFPVPEELLATMKLGAAMLAADAVVIAADSYGTVKTGDEGSVNPITGKKWVLGDMDEIARKDLAVERGILAEVLSLMRFERSGHWQAATLNYAHDRKRRRLRWGTVEVWDGAQSDRKSEELQMQARFPAEAREAFAQEVHVAKYGEPTTDETRDIADRLQHQLDVDFAFQVEDIGLLLEGPF